MGEQQVNITSSNQETTVFTYILPVSDLVLVTVLALALYFPRHRRKDLAMSYIAVNIGVLAVASSLNGTSVNAGLGLGLFGVLAIIRLRSQELNQYEVSYYFSALSLGVIGGLGADLGWWSIALMVAVVVAVGVADAPGVFRNYRFGQIVLDQAITDEALLRERLQSILGGQVLVTQVIKLDLVNDTTTVDVRYTVEI
jgi:hypothetical protein